MVVSRGSVECRVPDCRGMGHGTCKGAHSRMDWRDGCAVPRR